MKDREHHIPYLIFMLILSIYAVVALAVSTFVRGKVPASFRAGQARGRGLAGANRRAHQGVLEPFRPARFPLCQTSQETL